MTCFVTVGTTLFEGLINEILSDVCIEDLRSIGVNRILLQIAVFIGRYRKFYSHAGAGTCLEVLKLQKPFIVVINELLMDNHQAELAVALAEGAHLLHCTPFTLSETIRNSGLFTLIPYIPLSQKRVARFIDNRMGV
ncbi:unnamed protein product [Caenorhabditis angaria]|uniref:UDP-N-acetylglucosamine transferase subunit ALG13 n=1 Tax=Caenorhabditis angaria TaxID=860376 RepID=A0A9P1ITL5_9PELO|nr:unnamed protein product [Caenorhabditis angaria]